MSRRITFKLYGEERELSLAFQHHCMQEGLPGDLNTLAKLVWLRFLRDSIQKDPIDATAQAEYPGDTGNTQIGPTGITTTPLAESPDAPHTSPAAE